MGINLTKLKNLLQTSKDNNYMLYAQFLKFFFFMASCFLFIKIILFFVFYNLFLSLDFIDIVKALYISSKLDSVILGHISLLPLTAILILANFKNKFSSILMAFFVYLWIFLFIVCVFIMIGNLVYFNESNTHIFREFMLIKTEMPYFISLAFNEYRLISLASIVFIGVIFFISKTILNNLYYKNLPLKKQALGVVFVFVFFALSARGWHFMAHPLGVANVFEQGKLIGTLGANPLFLIAQTYEPKQSRQREFGLKKANDIYKKTYRSSNVKLKDDNLLFKKYTKAYLPTNKKYNVVVIIVESLEYLAIDAISGMRLNVSKNLDNLVKNGVYFDNFYANGRRSLEALSNIILAINKPKDAPNLGWGLVSLYNTKTIANYFLQNNYTTTLMQTAQRDSLMLDSSAKVSGFDNYYGASDYALLGDEQTDKMPLYQGWDGNMLKFANSHIDELVKIKKIPENKKNTYKPFFTMAFTATMHYPYTSAGKKYDIYKHSTQNINGYLNTLNYFDKKLGEFMQQAKNKPWFDDTIFIITADHISDWSKKSALLKMYQKYDKTKHEQHKKLRQIDKIYKIPFLIYAPKIFKPEIKHTIGSQVDIFATITHLLGFNNYFSSNANSLFDDSINKYNLIYENSGAWFFDKNNIIYHNYQHNKTAKNIKGTHTTTKKLNNIFLSIDKIISNWIFKRK